MRNEIYASAVYWRLVFRNKWRARNARCAASFVKLTSQSFESLSRILN